MLKIPIIPIIPVLQQFAKANNLPFDRKNWECIVRTFNKYNETAKRLN